MPPTIGNGKICYLEIPALDVERSSGFYKNVFGWNIRRREDGELAFDDGVGEVSGTWVLGRKSIVEPGLLVYIMVDDVDAATKSVTANGGRIAQPIGLDAPEITARFSDPAGNVLGLYQEPTDDIFVIQRTYTAPIEKVWKAITDVKDLRTWSFDMLDDFKPVVGFETRFDVKKGDNIYPHIWKVVEAVPGRKISFEWRYGGFPGNSVVTFELYPAGEKTRLVLIHRGLKTFLPDRHPELSKGNFAEGWTALIGKNLRDFFEAATSKGTR